MKKTEIVKKLAEKKSLPEYSSEYCKCLIDEICEYIDYITISSELEKKIIRFLDGIPTELENPIEKLEALNSAVKAELQNNITHKAKQKRRKKRNNAFVICLIVVLIVGTIVGVLSALHIMSDVAGAIVGVLDFTFGIGFFLYEYFDDKNDNNEIDSGDAGTIIKVVVKKKVNIKIKQKGVNINDVNNSFVVTGVLYVGSEKEPDEEIIKKLFPPQK